MHGLTYDRGVVFAASGNNAAVVAINTTTGRII